MKSEQMKPLKGSLVSFSNEVIYVQGYLELNVVIDEGQSALMLLVKFLSYNVFFSYNVIINRSTLNQIRVVVSTDHHTMNYLVGDNRIRISKVD